MKKKKKSKLFHIILFLILASVVVVSADYIKNKEITITGRLEEGYKNIVTNIEKWKKEKEDKKTTEEDTKAEEKKSEEKAEKKSSESKESKKTVTVSGITYEINGSEAKLIKCEKQDETIVLPQKVDGVLITVIASNAFEGCSNLKYIDIPEGVHTLETYSMADCHQLLYVVLPDSLKEIGYWSFQSDQINFICHKGTFAQEYAEMVKRPWFEGDRLQ